MAQLNESVLAKTFLTVAGRKVPLAELRDYYELHEAALTTAQLGEMSLEEVANKIRAEFDFAFRTQEEGPGSTVWVSEVFMGHSSFGDAVVARDSGEEFLVPFEITETGVLFEPRAQWHRVRRMWSLTDAAVAETEAIVNDAMTLLKAALPDYQSGYGLEPVQEDDPEDDIDESEGEMEVINFTEAAAHEERFSAALTGAVVSLEEGMGKWDGTGPLKIRAVLVEPGPGNERDGRYYPASMLKACAKVFEGGKMYATDHKADEKSVRTEVADILQCPVGFSDTGGPIAEIGIHDPTFAQATWNRHKLGTLGNLNLSIIGTGKVQKGNIGEAEYRVVTEIMQGSADFVTSAGAGGRAQAIVENDAGDPGDSMEETTMTQDEVKTWLSEQQGVPAPILERLGSVEYKDEASIQEALTAEMAYAQALTGAGNVEDMGEHDTPPADPPAAKMTVEEFNAGLDKIDQQFGLI